MFLLSFGLALALASALLPTIVSLAAFLPTSPTLEMEAAVALAALAARS